ncbi:MAG TPA: single-stranded DNA-binding protein [Erysipelotrichaceae bacterium]|nr:single-stranded DNA-binding protein [Erysipelotrichaceae bacterium]
MFNRAVFVGRLVRDPELRKTNSDISLANFTIAVDNRSKEADGTRGTLFLNCTVFRDQAENLVKYTRKGSLIAVDGSLNQRNFVRQDGSKGREIEVMVDRVIFLEPKRDDVNVETPSFDDTSSSSSGSNLDSIDLPDEDLPF